MRRARSRTVGKTPGGAVRAALLCAALALTGSISSEPAPSAAAPRHNPLFPNSGVFLTIWDASAGQRQLHLIDTDTGKPLSQPLTLAAGTHAGFLGASAFAPGRELLAVTASTNQSCEPFAGGTSCRGNAGTLHLVAPLSGGHTTVPLPTSGWVGGLSFSPDEQRVALALNGERATTLIIVNAALAAPTISPD